PGATMLEALPAACRPTSLMDGYRIQARARDLLRSRYPGPQIGWKIGATTAHIQKFLKVPHPIAGTLYQGTVYRGDRTVQAADYFNLSLECEIAVALDADVPGRPGGHDRHSVADTVGSVMASIELIEFRFEDFASVGAATLVGDDSLSAGCILGEPMPIGDIADLSALRGGFSIDGALPEETATGAAVLGHPLTALAWLADVAAGLGTPLKAGQIVSLGSLVQILPAQVGQVVEARIDRLPPVAVTIV
ncbi:MAG: hypothetical protein AAF666_13780, partial [Pseudomonadota bacterium]